MDAAKGAGVIRYNRAVLGFHPADFDILVAGFGKDCILKDFAAAGAGNFPVARTETVARFFGGHRGMGMDGFLRGLRSGCFCFRGCLGFFRGFGGFRYFSGLCFFGGFGG